MRQAAAPDEPARYRAFISYSHADSVTAQWLHRRIERYRLPADATGSRERLAPVFIDRAELPAAHDLTAQVRAALAGSAALIVIASPQARASQWVNREIELFRELHPDRPVLAALIEGEPDEAFPAALTTRADGQPVEPLAADFRRHADGKRLGLLKLVAGLSAQPLDRLVQRDSQDRQRRVMAVTAAALLLSLILAALLVFALRARAEAERQRASAEGMVEFMLTDLRDRLKGVGRLDVMDAVNARAMQRYSNETALADLPPDMLERRARLILAMAEDDLATVGKESRAGPKVKEAYRITETLLQSDPTKPDRLFTHAQSAYWKGYLAYLAARRGEAGQIAEAEQHWREYGRLAAELNKQEPTAIRSIKELGFAEGNLCTLLLDQPGRAAAATESCKLARKAMEQVAKRTPESIEAQLDLANRLAWEAEALAAVGQPGEAAALRRRQIAGIEGLLARQGTDARVREAAALAQLGLAILTSKQGARDEARTAARAAAAHMARLRQLDPANRNWRARETRIEKLLSELQ